jgi:hypothetical protein
LRYNISIDDMLDALAHIKEHHEVPDRFKKYTRMWKDNGIIRRDRSAEKSRWMPGTMFTTFHAYLLGRRTARNGKQAAAKVA